MGKDLPQREPQVLEIFFKTERAHLGEQRFVMGLGEHAAQQPPEVGRHGQGKTAGAEQPVDGMPAPRPPLRQEGEGHEQHGAEHERADRVHIDGAAREQQHKGAQGDTAHGETGPHEQQRPEVGKKNPGHRIRMQIAPESAVGPGDGDAHEQ